MSTTPQDLLGEARALLAGAETEVRRRTAVSRAYYAAFHAAWQFAASLGFTERPHRSVQGQVTRFLAGREEASLRQCAALLIRLRDLCNKADHHLRITVSNSLTEDAIADAGEILEILHNEAP